MATEQCLTHTSAVEYMPGGFECNICLDAVEDPVVTTCGHLYCWPCIYKWIQQQSFSPLFPSDEQQHTQCPVCKAEVSEATLIPLYGRGQSKGATFGPGLPERPKGPPNSVHHHRHHHYNGYSSAAPVINLGGVTTFQPLMGMFGEAVVGDYDFRNSYGLVATGSGRERRNTVRADRSLSRLSGFLFCCMVVCLVLF